MPKSTTPDRPYFKLDGDSLITKILAGEQAALDEATHRSRPGVRNAVAQYEASQAKGSTKATKAPAPKAAKVNTRSAKAVRSQVKATPKTQPTGRGSRGGDPIKALRADVADLMVSDKATNFGEWITAYKTTNGMSEPQLRTAIRDLKVLVSA